jgi:hypothetical protein
MKRCNIFLIGFIAFGVTVASGCGSETKGTDATSSDTMQSKFAPLYSGYFQGCKRCHTPGAWGQVTGIEQSLDFSTEDTAYDTITKGSATGLQGNQEACNGVPFVSSTYDRSLIAAVIDEDVRANFSVGGCEGDAVSDMTVKVGSAPSAEFLGALKDWIESGTPR